MRYAVIPVTPLQQNCSLVWCEETMKAAFVDPGGETDGLKAAVEEAEVTLENILVTHGHLDHGGAVADLAEEFGLPIEGPHPEDKFWIDQLPTQGQEYGFGELRAFTPDRWLDQGDTCTVGTQTFEVLHCPGHKPGHVVFFHRGERVAFVGDVLFQGSVGRSDFPCGDGPTLIKSIRENLFLLGDDVTFVPGHGPLSTFRHERESNPFVADRLFPCSDDGPGDVRESNPFVADRLFPAEIDGRRVRWESNPFVADRLFPRRGRALGLHMESNPFVADRLFPRLNEAMSTGQESNPFVADRLFPENAD